MERNRRGHALSTRFKTLEVFITASHPVEIVVLRRAARILVIATITAVPFRFPVVGRKAFS
jgi:hypothetical protein